MRVGNTHPQPSLRSTDTQDADPRRWTNPLETRLPNAPSMQIYCLYGHGKPTERGYVCALGRPSPGGRT